MLGQEQFETLKGRLVTGLGPGIEFQIASTHRLVIGIS